MPKRRKTSVTLKIKQIPVAQMFIDYADDGGYQRKKREEKAIAFAENFEEARYEPIHVSLRSDNRFAVVEGQTRYWMAILLGFRTMQAIVHEKMSRKDEAALFRKLNGPARQKASAYDNYRSALCEGDPFITSLNGLLESAGWRVQQGTQASRVIKAVTSLETAYRQHGAEPLLSALWLLEPWSEDNKPSGPLLHGMVDFVANYGASVDLKKLREKLAKVPAATIERRAKGKSGGGAGAMHTFVMYEILAEWQKGRRKTGHLEDLGGEEAA